PTVYVELSYRHRPRHSFPTRRSSDLLSPQARVLEDIAEADAAATGLIANAAMRQSPIIPTRLMSFLPFSLRACPGLPSLQFVSQDRKSTRLNSSHGSISYAVFCLKKK